MLLTFLLLENSVKYYIERENKMKRFARKGRTVFIIIFSVFSSFMLCMTQKANVYGNSMTPFLRDGDCVFVERFSYLFGSPKRFDVVIFRYRNSEKTYIKRIIGLPGETVQIVDGAVIINGETLKESTESDLILNPGRAVNPILLGDNEYFILGDNRNNSSDSRNSDIGNIKKSELIGKIWISF